MAGNARSVGVGSDLDGGYGPEQTPRDLDTIADLQKLDEILARRGYTERDVDAVLHRNWLDFFTRHLPPYRSEKKGSGHCSTTLWAERRLGNSDRRISKPEPQTLNPEPWPLSSDL